MAHHTARPRVRAPDDGYVKEVPNGLDVVLRRFLERRALLRLEIELRNGLACHSR